MMKALLLASFALCMVVQSSATAADQYFSSGVIAFVTQTANPTNVSPATFGTNAFPGELGGAAAVRKNLRLVVKSSAATACQHTTGNVECYFGFEFNGVYKVGTKTEVTIIGMPDAKSTGHAGTIRQLFSDTTSTAGTGFSPVSNTITWDSSVATKFNLYQSTVAVNGAAPALATATATNMFLFSGPTTTTNTAFQPQCGMSIKGSYLVNGAGSTSLTQHGSATATQFDCSCDVATAVINSAGDLLTLGMKIEKFDESPTTVGINFRQEGTLASGATVATTLAETKAITETALTTAAASTYTWDSNAAKTGDKFDLFTYMVVTAGSESKGTTTGTNASLKMTIPATKTDTVWSAFETSCNAGYMYVVAYCFDTARTAALGGVPAMSAANPKKTVIPVPIKVTGCAPPSGAVMTSQVWAPILLGLNAFILAIFA